MTNKQWTEIGIAMFLLIFFITIMIADRRKKSKGLHRHGDTEKD